MPRGACIATVRRASGRAALTIGRRTLMTLPVVQRQCRAPSRTRTRLFRRRTSTTKGSRLASPIRKANKARRSQTLAAQLARSADHNGYYQGFDYDAFGSVKRVLDSSGNTLQSSTYNVRGMLTNALTWTWARGTSRPMRSGRRSPRPTPRVSRPVYV